MIASNWKTSGALRTRTRCLLLLVLVGALVGAASAQEEQSSATDICMLDAECSSHFRQGRRLSKAGQLEAAVEEYRTAYQRRAAPWLLFNIGRTLHKLGRLKEALSYYERFLATDQGNNPEWKQRATGFLEEAQRDLKNSAQPAAASDKPKDSGVSGAAPAPPSHPVYKRWWFWTAIGAVVAGAVITGVVVGTRPVTPANDTVYQPMF